MKVADTSFLFALFNATDRRHAHARAAFAAGRVVIPTEVLTELIGLATAKLGRPAAKRAFQVLVDQPNVLISGELDAGRAIAMAQQHPKLSFVDACVVACCEGRKCGVLAYDQRIEDLVGA